jgi:NTP pyrophosphatase (non-canonical NTP hydrolase)
MANAHERYLQEEAVFDAITDERRRQVEKFGDQSGNPDERWLTILTEEVGEIAEAVLDYDSARLNAPAAFAAGLHLKEEITQAAAVLVAWLETWE